MSRSLSLSLTLSLFLSRSLALSRSLSHTHTPSLSLAVGGLVAGAARERVRVLLHPPGPDPKSTHKTTRNTFQPELDPFLDLEISFVKELT